jgi:hypothetical protein
VVFLVTAIRNQSSIPLQIEEKNQLPKLSRTALIVIIPCAVVVVWWIGGFITDYKTTPTKVVSSYFGLLVGLWQHVFCHL